MLEFKKIRGKIENVIDDIINQTFSNKKYETSTMQRITNVCSEEIVKQCQVVISEEYLKEFKLIAETIIL